MPENLKLNGNQETFTVRILYDTLELYGKQEGSRTFTISQR